MQILKEPNSNLCEDLKNPIVIDGKDWIMTNLIKLRTEELSWTVMEFGTDK